MAHGILQFIKCSAANHCLAVSELQRTLSELLVACSALLWHCPLVYPVLWRGEFSEDRLPYLGCCACRVVADKAYETGIPQKLGEHANTARDTAAAKYGELTNQVSLSHRVQLL